MKTIRFSILISSRAIATARWYDDSIACSYNTSDIHMANLVSGEYYVTIAAHLLQDATMSILIDDITDLANPRNLFAAVCTQVFNNFRQPYNV